MITADIQGLTPGAEVTLFKFDGTAVGAGVLWFHGYFQAGQITWQGQQYEAWPIKAEGFAYTSDRPPTPKLSLGNVDGSLSTLCAMYQDLLGAEITRKRTLVKYLDAVNFPGGNPTADPDEHWEDDIWYIDRKSYEDNIRVEFELASPLDLQNVQLPRRQIVAGRCPWLVIGGYRGPYCGYAGPPVAKADDTPTSDPALDRCGGRVISCKLRFGEDQPLSTGAFPSSSLVRL